MRDIKVVLQEIMVLVEEAQSLLVSQDYECDESWVVQEAKALEEDRSVREKAMKTET